MIIVASRPPLTLQRLYKMRATPRRVNARSRRKRVVKKVTDAFDPIHGAQLTTTMFTTAVFVYSSLNYFMYRRIRKEHEENEKK